HDWRAILSGIATVDLVSTERVADTANRTLELAEAEREVWGFRDVASVRATRLGDEGGAREALETGMRTFLESRGDLLGDIAELFGQKEFARGYQWVLLGRGFSETLKDLQGARRCLEAGLRVARAQCNADDVCAIA